MRVHYSPRGARARRPSPRSGLRHVLALPAGVQGHVEYEPTGALSRPQSFHP
jgi:hypothetical protein